MVYDPTRTCAEIGPIACELDTGTCGREGSCCLIYDPTEDTWVDGPDTDEEAPDVRDIRDADDSAAVGKETRQFIDWWERTSEKDLRVMLPKRVAYGAADLRIIGRGMAELVGKPEMSDEEAVELGVAFYALGKVARIVSGFTTGGDRTDSWHDLTVYSMMARACRSGVAL